MTNLTKLTVDVELLEKASYNVQRREPWYYAIVSSQNGETVLEAVIQEDMIIVRNKKTFTETKSVHITFKGKPVAVCDDHENKKELIWSLVN